MKLSRIVTLILLIAIAAHANPRHRNSHRSHYPNYRHNSYYYSGHYNNHFSAYGYYRYYTPVVLTTQTTTTYPSNLVLVTADSVAEDIVLLNSIMMRGLITEKDYDRAKTTLLNRIGMAVNPQAQELSLASIVDQIETLYQMQTRQLLTEKEYQKQKSKLLALI